jgi:hypothetical protein
MPDLVLTHKDQVAICAGLGINPYDSRGALVNPPTSASLIAAAAALPARKKEFEMKRDSIETVVDSALREGRIEVEHRDAWLRFFEMSPESATAVLAASRPDSGRAYRNFADDERERRAISISLNIPLEKVL